MIVKTHDAIHTPLGSGEPIVIVGSGVVGLYLAKLLSEQGHHVVVVEVGNTKLALIEKSFTSVGRNHNGIHNGRSHSLGGTSNLWGGQLVEFKPSDIDGGDGSFHQGWPISYEEVARHYKTTFQRLGIPEKFQQDEHVWKSVAGKVPAIGGDIQIFLTRWLSVPKLAVLYKNAIRYSSNLQILVNHQVCGFCGADGIITGVRVQTPQGKQEVIAAATVVVVAGAIETNRLLLAAAVDKSWECPWRNNRMLGRYFQDHLAGKVGIIHPINRKSLNFLFGTIYSQGMKFQPKIRLSDARLESTQLPKTLGAIQFESSISENLNYLKQFLKAAIYSRKINNIKDLLKHAAACARHLPRLAMAYLRYHRIFSPNHSTVMLMIQTEQVPLADSKITIDPNKVDSAGVPYAVLDWRIDGCELQSIREFLLAVRDTLLSSGIGRLEIDPRILAEDPSFLASLRDANHAAGGCIMGRTPKDGVVDGDLKVFGTKNLFVAGTAVFPSSSDANVAFTAMALATRLAERLATYSDLQTTCCV